MPIKISNTHLLCTVLPVSTVQRIGLSYVSLPCGSNASANREFCKLGHQTHASEQELRCAAYTSVVDTENLVISILQLVTARAHEHACIGHANLDKCLHQRF